MLGRLWAAVTRWFRSGPESTVAAGNAQTPQQPPVKEDQYSHPEPAVEKLLEKTAAAKGTQVEASLASRNAELQKLPAKLDEQEKPVPAAEKLLEDTVEDTAAANRKEAEASVSNKATASAPTAELQKSPAEVAKVDTQEKPVSAAEKLLEDRATAKRKEVEASVSTKASAPPAEIEESPAKVSKVDTQEKPVPSAEKSLESRATAKRKEVEASVFAKAGAPTAELQRSPAKVTKVDKQEKPAPAAEKLLEDTAAAKRKEVEASVSTKASAPTAELKKSPAKVSKVDTQEKSVPSAEKLLADRAAAKRKQVEASLSFKASAESVANLPSGEPCNLAKGTGATGIAQASIVSEASSSTLPRRLEELKQTLKDKQEKLAVSASIDGDRSGRRSSFLPQADATEERPLNIFGGVGEGFEDVPPRKRRVVLKPPPKVHSRDWASDQSDQSVSEHSSELRDWRLLDQPIQTELDSPDAGEAKAKASKKRKRGKKKKKGEAEEAHEAEKPQSELEKDIKGQPSQVEAGRTVEEQEGEDETPTKRAKKRKKRKKDKDHKESHKEAEAMQVEQPIHADLEKGDDGLSQEQNGIMSVSSGSGEDQDYGVVECKFVAENDAALGLRRRIQRHKTRELEDARKEEKKARKKAGKAAEKALKALRKAEKAEAKAEGFGFKKNNDAARSSQEAEWTALRELSQTCGRVQDDWDLKLPLLHVKKQERHGRRHHFDLAWLVGVIPSLSSGIEGACKHVRIGRFNMSQLQSMPLQHSGTLLPFPPARALHLRLRPRSCSRLQKLHGCKCKDIS